MCHGGESARTQILAEIAAVLERGYTSAEGCLCVQAIFALTDVLKDWLEQRRPATPSSASRPLCCRSRTWSRQVVLHGVFCHSQPCQRAHVLLCLLFSTDQFG